MDQRWAGAAVLISMLVGLYVRINEGFVEPVSDAATYVKIASAFTTHPVIQTTMDWSVGGLAMRGVTYPLLVATLLTLGGSLAAIAWFQSMVLVPGTVLLVFLTGRRAFSPVIGVIGAFGYALWVPAQIYTSLTMQETWLAFLVALLLYLASRCLTGGRWEWNLSLGLLLGVLAITHSAFQLVGIALLAALAMHRWVFDRPAAKQTLVVAVGLAAILVCSAGVRAAFDLPAQGEGARGYGGGGGWTFWIGSNPGLGFRQPVEGYKYAELRGENFVQMADSVRAGELDPDPNLREIILRKAASDASADHTLTDSDFYRAGVQNLLSRPSALPHKVAIGLRSLLTVPPGLAYYRSQPSAADPGGPWQFFNVALFVVGISGLGVIALRHRDRLVLAVPLLVQSFVLIAAYPENRHVIPLWGSLFLFGAVGIQATRLALQKVVSLDRDPRPAMTMVVTFTVGLSVASISTATGSTPAHQGLPTTLAATVYDRETLVRTVFGARVLPSETIDTDAWQPIAQPTRGVSKATVVNSAVVELRFGLTSTLNEFVPAAESGCGLIVQGGHASWTEGGGLEVAKQALANGCRVIAIDMPGQGTNSGQIAELDSGDPLALDQADKLHNAFYTLAPGSRDALDVYMTPVVAAVDRLTATTSQPPIMTGLSGGGWSTSLAAALDPRITRSLAVAGSTTVDPQQPCGGDYEQCLPALYKQVPMEQIYTLAAVGADREHVQILNYYDPCCFAKNTGSTWAPQVQAAVEEVGAGGDYVFLADRTQPGQHAYPATAFEVLDGWERQT